MINEETKAEDQAITDETDAATVAAEAEAAENEAAFESGFTGEDVPASSEAVATEEAEAVPAEEAVVEPVVAKDAASILAGMSAEQIEGLLAIVPVVNSLKTEFSSTKDSLFGRFGELKRTLKEMQESAPTTEAGAKLKAAKLTRLREEFPEVADALEEDWSAMGGQQNDEDFDARLAPHIEAVRSDAEYALEKRMLQYMRPNWMSESQSSEFAAFKSQLSPEDQDTYATSRSADEIVRIHKDFDAWKEKAAEASLKQEKEAERTAAEAARKAEKSNRLESAVTPRGTQTDHTPSDNDAFESGFKSAQGQS